MGYLILVGAFYIISYLSMCLVVASVGRHRQIGFGLGFLWSFLLSPVLGLAIVLYSKSHLEIYLEALTGGQQGIITSKPESLTLTKNNNESRSTSNETIALLGTLAVIVFIVGFLYFANK